MSRALLIVFSLVLLCAIPSNLWTSSASEEASTVAAGPVFFPQGAARAADAAGLLIGAGPVLWPFGVVASEGASRLIAVGPVLIPVGVALVVPETAGRLIAAGPLMMPGG